MNIQSVLLFLTTMALLSCNQKKNGYKADCNFEKKQAQNAFRYKNYTWTIFSGMGYDYIGEEEFKKLLGQHQIKTKEVLASCTTYPNDKYENCGDIEMNRLIKEKLGKNFIDSLQYIAKQRFVKNHPEEVFPFESCDQTPRYPGATPENQSDKIQADYLTQYPTPKKYIRKNEAYYSYTSANFVITKTGEIKDLSVESSLQNKKNNIFEKQFNKQLKNFVLHTKWIPGKINGLNVDSYYGVTIHYK